MASVKVLLRARKNADGTQPLVLQIIKNRKSSIIHLGYHLHAKDWDAEAQKVKRSHPNSARLNNFILKKVAEATDTTLELETAKPTISSKAVKEKLKPDSSSSFFSYANLYLERLKAHGKYNQYTADKPRIKHFQEFLKGHDPLFIELSVSTIERFKTYLKAKNTLSERTIINHLATLRSVYSLAIKESIIDKSQSPFGSDKVRIVFPQTLKIGLTTDEVKRIESLKFEKGSLQRHVRNLWLFSFYLAGMRASDVLRLKWSDIQNGRLFYSMGKNAKAGSLALPEKALTIIEEYAEYKRENNGYIFPELKKITPNTEDFIIQRTIAFAVSRIDKYLKKYVAPVADINKPLTMHIARHTFGNISGDRIPIQMLQKLYRHSSVTTTIGYQSNFIQKEADDALRKVIET
ncbi:phage integrase SAM-like domain-containing protein [Sediminibacterium sp.]|uniref:phage integrase SAM-like domain-containing protein n=1 Tax=Sediminibacterium sp. TaxID=1917865 RepID=UPI003F6A067C